MSSFWTKAARLAADLQSGNDGADNDVIRADFAAEAAPRPSIRREHRLRPMTSSGFGSPTNSNMRSAC
jgi:hypothetical protein